MKRWLLTLILASAAAIPAGAQYPGQYPGTGGQPGFTPAPGQYQPNIYNRQTQPLSPYLNLLRGQGNAGIDYYYGVRPGLQSGGQPFSSQSAGGGFGNLNNSQMRTGYLPQAGYPTSDPIPLPDAGEEVILAPSGHPVSYGNVFGISRTGIPGAGTNRAGFFPPPKSGTVKKAK